MVLHRNNFAIPAQFAFKPFEAQLRMRTAKLLDWNRRTELYGDSLMMRLKLVEDRDGESLTGEITIPGTYDINTVVGADSGSENNLRNPIGRQFPVFASDTPKSERKTKNAWAMRDEILNITNKNEDEQVHDLLLLLNKWGLWWMWADAPKDSLLMRRVNPFLGMSFAFPHLILRDCEKYRQALLPKNAGKWFSKAELLNVVQTNKPPYFLVERYDCARAIEATITIDHLSGRRFGFCQRCGKQFEQETQRKKNYCSRTCINAATVQHWRENRRKVPK